MSKLSIKAPAKLNLHLQVLDKRTDGYHNISSYFTLIDFFDELEFSLKENEIILNESEPINNNLVKQAAELLKKYSKTSHGIEITLNKNIPLKNGLGGGSSDAATTLVALNKIWGLNYSKQQLQEFGLQLGSDIPFFINGFSSWAEGRGEILSPITLKESWFLLILPKTKISTKLAFDSIENNTKNLISKKDFLNGKRMNSFSEWARKTYKELDIIFEKLELLGDPQLTGTGAAIFLQCSSKLDAEQKLLEVPEGVLVKSLDHSPLLQIIE